MADIRKNGKQYGLICPKKAPLSAPKAINVFGGDDDTDEDDGTDWVKKSLKAEGEKNRVKKQTRLNMQRALDEDPTIYQYDEVFDEMKQTEEQGKAIKKEAKKSKYIGNLLKTADRRKREQEHRIERMVQKEREAEGEMYADKESFVTSAYKAKLEELKKMEEEEENMDRLEAIGDVTKQPDMSGFYRHFFQQTVDPVKNSESDAAAKKESDAAKKESKNEEDSRGVADKTNVDRDDDLTSSSASERGSDSEHESRSKKSTEINPKVKGSRQYRQRVIEASDSESEAEEPKEKEVEIAERDKSSKDKPSSEEVEESRRKKMKPSVEDQQPGKDTTIKEKPTEFAKPTSIDNAPAAATAAAKREENAKPEKPAVEAKEEKKNKISIWEKRTVGPAFEAALQRYYVRKAARLSGS